MSTEHSIKNCLLVVLQLANHHVVHLESVSGHIERDSGHRPRSKRHFKMRKCYGVPYKYNTNSLLWFIDSGVLISLNNSLSAT